METPLSRATRMAEVMSTETVWEAWDDLDVDAAREPLVVYFVSAMYGGPYRPDGRGREGSSYLVHGEWGEAVEEVVSWLRGGDGPESARKRLHAMQVWDWGAIATDEPSLRDALEARYKIGDCETELLWFKIPGGILVTCGVLYRGPEM